MVTKQEPSPITIYEQRKEERTVEDSKQESNDEETEEKVDAIDWIKILCTEKEEILAAKGKSWFRNKLKRWNKKKVFIEKPHKLKDKLHRLVSKFKKQKNYWREGKFHQYEVE
jgi:hypothetical protein